MLRLNRPAGSIVAILALMLSTSFSGCAPKQTQGAASGSQRVSVIVENTTTSFLTIWAVPPAGVRLRVGEVPSNQTETLTFTPVITGNYRLIAERLSGAELASNPVTVFPGETVRWNLTSNIATVVS